MKTLNLKGLAAATAAAAIALSGCQTTGDTRDQATGAGIGAALGCGVGLLVGGQAKHCLAGAAAGGLLGWGVVKLNQYQSQQVRSTTSDQRVYGLTQPVNSTQVKIRNGTSSPKSVKAGQDVKIAMDYSLMLPPGQSNTSVKESWVLKKDGKVLANLPPQTNQRSAGGWEASASIPIPGDAKPGTYVVEHRVNAGSSYDEDESTFVVRA
ncbi:MAG: hypothetical protein U9Q81_04530 [Pseudomonadota bacterium]|nr:hypothetical protein [Pseudomonadota bacterium]